MDTNDPVAVISGVPQGSLTTQGPTNADTLTFTYTSDHGGLANFECVESFQCAVAKGITTSAPKSAWAACTSNARLLCQARIAFTVRVNGAGQAWTDAHRGLLASSFNTLLADDGFKDTKAVFTSTAAVEDYPFKLMYRGGKQPGSSRFAALASASGPDVVVTQYNMTLPGCLLLCTRNLACKLAYLRVHNGHCIGLSTVDTEPEADTLESFSYLRRNTTALAPAAEFHFHVETAPYVLCRLPPLRG